MQDSAKYLIHANIRASGVVERSDVVGAIFGQTEGLLGSDLDLRDLQESSKVGRIDVDIDSEGGRSFGTVTVASGLDRVETAVLAAALETIERVGPCRAELRVSNIEDARAAKRRELVDRAVELLAEFDDRQLTSEELLAEVRQRAEVGDITDYEGLPAGPRVADSDAVIVVEGRADVRQLLGYGIKNAVAVEGTDVPDAVAELSADRTVTAFLDGDRGGDLILRELAQVGDVDYVAIAPTGESVEDLSREAVLDALREKVPYEEFEREAPSGSDESAPPVDADGGSTVAAEAGSADATGPDSPDGSTDAREPERSDDRAGSSTNGQSTEAEAGEGTTASEDDGETDASDEPDGEGATPPDGAESVEQRDASAEPETLPGHVSAVIGGQTGRARLLDAGFGTLAEVDADGVFDAVADAEAVPAAVVLDGPLSQRVLDVAAQRGVGQVVAADTDSFVKQPTGVRVRTAADFEAAT
ncbi:DNA primase DnaG [Salinirussus salinus]|jgi:5S rRNA maturation endonuclease (ribonuclease M5)|uniref:DNA primase DnaG n=1 Tax=Salinirussus salinus TaxID=1198300 RepID=UPI00135961BD|nr:DNA primase DnaG [Salinirussus salinus]